MPADPVAPPSDGVFTVGRRGYDPHQVDAHLRRLDAEIRILVADRDAAVDQAAQLGRDLEEARLRADRLRTQVRTMAARPSDVQGMSERMRTMLRLAEDEVADMLRRADDGGRPPAGRGGSRGGAGRRRRLGGRPTGSCSLPAATREASLDAAARHRAETDAACAADRRSLAEERAAAEHAIALAGERAEQERTSAWAESERRRATVEEDFSLAMDQRRAEALAAIQAERAQTEQWVQRHEGRGRPAGPRRDHGRRGDRPAAGRRGPGPRGRSSPTCAAGSRRSCAARSHSSRRPSTAWRPRRSRRRVPAPAVERGAGPHRR